MRHRLVFCLAISLFTCHAVVLRAQWVPATTPSSWKIWTLAVNGPDLFAGTTEGLFHSVDNGVTWTAATKGLINTNIRSIAVIGGTLFAGTDGSGVYRSANNGASWIAGKGFPNNLGVTSFASIGTNIFAGTSVGVFESVDNGLTWTSVSNGLANERFDAILASGTNLFVGSNTDNAGGGVFLSTDSGASWTEVGLGYLSVSSLALAGNSAPTLLAGTYTGGAFQATTQGTNWTPSNTGLLDAASGPTITVLLATGANVYAASGAGGVVRSTDNGSSWTPINTGLPIMMVSALAASSTQLFAAIDSTVWWRPLP